MAFSAKDLSVQFVLSVAAPAQLPPGNRAEIAFLGRSNVGKSSLLNSLTHQHGLAHVSKTPGRTRLLNFFEVKVAPQRNRPTPPAFFLVDLPGYGYAKVPRSMTEEWGVLIEPYLARREQLTACILLVDSMLPPQPKDLELFAWLQRRGRNIILVATKSDRLSGNQRSNSLRALTEAFGIAPLPYSSASGEGRDSLWNLLFDSALLPES